MTSSLFKDPKVAEFTKPTEIESIVDFDDVFDPNSGWMSLWYGISGCGKTWMCGTAQNSLYINTGQGTDTLKSPLFLSKYPHIVRKSKDIVQDPKGKGKLGFDVICDTIDTFLNDRELREFVRTVIIDDATSFRSLAMKHGMKATGQDISKFVESDMRYIKLEMDRINWFLENYMPVFRAEGINFVMTAHESRIYGKADKMGNERPLKEIRPGFSGEKFPDSVPSKFDEVWYLELKRDKNGYFPQVKTGGGGVELTKTRRNGVFASYELGKDYEQLLQQRKENKLHPSYQTQTQTQTQKGS